MTSSSPAKAIIGLVEGVTEKWARQRKAEERDESARLRRDDRLVYYVRPVFRARHQPKGQNYKTALELGPPPVEWAIQTNRMSPPGIVMMYAAEDADTALAETANQRGDFAVGKFRTEREALILDWSLRPYIPTIFHGIPDSLEYDPRPRLSFLREISRDISRSIARDDCVHIEYVPT